MVLTVKRVCCHPEWRPTTWDQPRPEPAEMVGACEHNQACPVCGFGWGCQPDPCDRQRAYISAAQHEALLTRSLEEHRAIWQALA